MDPIAQVPRVVYLKKTVEEAMGLPVVTNDANAAARER